MSDFSNTRKNVSPFNEKGGRGGGGGGYEYIGNQGVQLEKLQWFGWS